MEHHAAGTVVDVVDVLWKQTVSQGIVERMDGRRTSTDVAGGLEVEEPVAHVSLLQGNPGNVSNRQEPQSRGKTRLTSEETMLPPDWESILLRLKGAQHAKNVNP